MDSIDKAFENLMVGLDRSNVLDKSFEYQNEFAEYMDSTKTAEIDEDMAFRSFICHKVAALDIVLQRVVDHLNED